MIPADSSVPPRRDLVLIGGGHSHVGVLRAFMMRPEPGLRLTLIAKELEAPYSGMLPGFVAGMYTREDAHIDLLPLAQAAGARLIIGAATGLDLEERRVFIEGRDSLRFDLLSLNVGITPRLNGVEGAAAHGIAVKPVSQFAARWEALRKAAAAADGPRRIAVIGGGAAGFELSLAAARRLRAEADAPDDFDFTLISGGPLLIGFARGVQAAARKALAETKVHVIEGDAALSLSGDAIQLASGAVVPCDAALIAADAQAPTWLAKTGLARDAEGYLAVAPTLESLSHPGVFAAGDCAAVEGYPRPKAGVFAVRQGPPLAANLRRAARDEPLRPFRPQSRFLSLLATADGSAIASRGGWSAQGAWVWSWKDRIDRAFMDKHRPAPMAQSDAMRCGGCAAKIGPATLNAALARLGDRPPAEDAAILDQGGRSLRLESVDYFRAFWSDPWLFGRIAANHALGDLYAMGAEPETAQAIVTLPRLSPTLAAEDLFQITAGARSLLQREGIALVGGHSGEGAEMAVGFSVSGRAPRAGLLRKGGLKAGDRLILTRPIGSGVLFAAAMRGLAKGSAIQTALEAMQRSHAPIVEILQAHGATAATDVTGFGLAGHLLEMLEASNAFAQVDLSAVPLYPQARALAEAGMVSTLLPENLAQAGRLAAPSGVALDALSLAVLLDPQTSGPLLVATPQDNAINCLAALRVAGATEAAIIGVVESESSLSARICVHETLAPSTS